MLWQIPVRPFHCRWILHISQLHQILSTIGTVIYPDGKFLVFHPGKCGGTTIEHLFLRTLMGTGIAQLAKRDCFNNSNNANLTDKWQKERIKYMFGYLGRRYRTNGVWGIYLQHADIQATILLHGKAYIDSLFKITFVRNPFARDYRTK